MEYLSKFQELIDRAEERQYLPETGVYLEEAARLALKNSDMPNALLARYLYTFAVAPMEPEKALVSFSWCIAHARDAEEVLPAGSLAQLYGIAIGILRSYPNYSLETIENTFEEMEELYEHYGLNWRDIWHQRLYFALSTGRRDDAAEYYRKWQDSQPDAFACRVCDRGTQVLYHLHREDYDAGFRHARPILEGEITCPHGQPLMTYASTLVPLIRVGRIEEATVNFRATRALLLHLSYAGIWAAGRQLSYLSLVGDIDEAIASFDDYFLTAMNRGTPADRYGYLLAARSAARRVVDERDAERSQRFLKTMELVPDAESDSIDEALIWLDGHMRGLAAAFDERNGNGEFTRVANLFEKIYEESAQYR